DFLSMALHEIGHNLGFVSGLDGMMDIFQLHSGDTRIEGFTGLDLFRHSIDSTAVENSDGSVSDLTLGGNSYFSIDGGTTNLGDFSGGDEFQASHWERFQTAIGVMDPTLAYQERLSITERDLQALDVLGWDVRYEALNKGLDMDALLVQAEKATARYLGVDSDSLSTLTGDETSFALRRSRLWQLFEDNFLELRRSRLWQEFEDFLLELRRGRLWQEFEANDFALLKDEFDTQMLELRRSRLWLEFEDQVMALGLDQDWQTVSDDFLALSRGRLWQEFDNSYGQFWLSKETHGNTLDQYGIWEDGLVTDPDSGQIAGTNSDDILGGSEQKDLINGSQGDDLIDGKAGDDLLLGGEGNDIVYGWDGDDLILGGDGDDLLAGENDNDQIFGEAGHDILSGGRGDDQLSGGDGRDVLEGDIGNDVLDGGADEDQLSGSSGDDVLIGGDGQDTLEGGTGNDVLYGDQFFIPVVVTTNTEQKQTPSVPPSTTADDALANTDIWMRLEAEDMQLVKYGLDNQSGASGGQVIASQGNNSKAKTTFNGPNGTYDLVVGYQNDAGSTDGIAVEVKGANGKTTYPLQLNGATGTGTYRIAGIVLELGDKITISGDADIRLDYLDILTEGTSPTFDETGNATNLYQNVGSAEQSVFVQVEQMDLTGGATITPLSPASSGGYVAAKTGDSFNATSLFQGETGYYDVVVGYYDDNSGAAELNISIDNTELDRWFTDLDLGNTGDNLVNRTVAEAVHITQFDLIEFGAVADGGDLGNLDYIQFIEVDAPVSAPKTLTFQQGVDGYAGTFDTYIDADRDNKKRGNDKRIKIEYDNKDEVQQGLIRFEDIFGAAENQISSEDTISSAILEFEVRSGGHSLEIYDMFRNWTEDDTWKSLGDGIQTDGIEASNTMLTSTDWVSSDTTLRIDVTSSLQAWQADPSQNFGWAILPTGSNRVELYSSEENKNPVPRLVIDLNQNSNASGNPTPVEASSPEPPPEEFVASDNSDTIRGGEGNDTAYGGEGNDLIYGDEGDDVLYGDFAGAVQEFSPATLTFQQGLDGYLGTVDTYVETYYATHQKGTNNKIRIENSNNGVIQGLIRFDDIFGDTANQISGSDVINSAILEFDVTDGGDSLEIYELFRSWTGSDTWNSLGNGIQTDGMEASSTMLTATGLVSSSNTLQIDVTASLQAWQADPSQNFGWLMHSTGSDRVTLSSAEDTGNTAPRLIIDVDQAQLSTSPVSETTENYRLELESMNISGQGDLTFESFASGGGFMEASDETAPVKATTLFSGQAGYYDVVLGYYDVNKGAAEIAVKVNNVELNRWDADQNFGSDIPDTSTQTTYTVAQGVYIGENELIEIFATKSGYGDTGNIDYIQLFAVENPAAQALGESGNDTLVGGSGNDTLVGGNGNDSLNGTDNIAVGVFEIDDLTGGAGADKFILGDTDLAYYGTEGNADYAIIRDFTSEDTLQLHGSIANYAQTTNVETG
ncbi:MAG: NF038122 family metalloprotease, partial [Leptolyngbyaceae cyanobacterium]